MRSCYATLMFLFGSAILHGQPYLPLAIENATWIETYGVAHFTYFQHYAFKIQGDTVFEGREYKKLYRWELADNTGAPYQIEGVFLTALIRDDTVSRRVYGVLIEEQLDIHFCYFNPPQEVLLYDFAIAVGDTLHDCMTDVLGPWAFLESVSIENIYGMDRRVWPFAGDFSLIEGIGTSHGLFSFSNLSHHAAYGPVSMDYCIGDNFECGLHTATSDITRETELYVFPNPVSDLLQLKADRQYTLSTILSYDGARLGDFYISETQEINVSHLLPGIYTMLINDENARMIVARFVKL